MQEKHLFEYAVIRVMPRVERQEFLNVGVIMYCAGQKFLQAKIALDKDRLSAFRCELDMEDLEKRLCVFMHICRGVPEGGPIARLPIDSRFRWLTATRSTIVQTSPVHPGLSADVAQTLERLYADLVQ
ncbi:MAG: DUF3037 domain-containing protein [Chitinophagaceae bacterium]